MQRRALLPLFLVFLSAVLVDACTDEPSTSPTERVGPTPALTRQGGEPVPDRYIVILSVGVGNADFVAKQIGANVNGQVHVVFNHIFKGFSVTLPKGTPPDVLRQPLVTEIHPVVIMTPGQQVQSNPPWGLDRVDQHTLPLDAQFTSFQTGAGINVYIIDSGILTGHAQFEGRAIHHSTQINDGRGSEDCFGHGTNVAGVVGGKDFGVAKQATLYAVRIADCNGATTSDFFMKGIDTVTANHVHPAVATTSYGTEAGFPNATIDQAVGRAIAHGLPFTVLAHNQNANACTSSPARLAEAITVAASTEADARASFSNYGTCVDVFAPGDDIRTAGIASATDEDTVDGTSFATPHVAGVAALILSENGTLPPAYVQTVIKESATKNVLSGIGTGSPNALLYSIHTYVDINGPRRVGCGTHTWSPAPLGGDTAFTTAWYERSGTTGPWVFKSNNWSYTKTLSLPWTRHFSVRLDLGSHGDIASDSSHSVFNECGQPH